MRLRGHPPDGFPGLSFVTTPTGSIVGTVGQGPTELVGDTSPQLGGNLDPNGHNVGDASAGDLTKLAAITASAADINHVGGVTSGVQAQLDGKATAAQGALADTAVQPAALATVATSGDYADLTGTLPVVDELADLDTAVTGTQLNALKTKVDGVEAGADVTDAVNVAAAVHGAASKTTPVDADELGLIDSAAAWVLKTLSWANLKTALGAWYDAATRTLSNKTLVAPKVDTIFGSNGHEVASFATKTAAVNFLLFANAATGGGPAIETHGDDDSIPIVYVPKNGAGFLVWQSAGDTTVWRLDGPASTIGLDVQTKGGAPLSENGVPVVTKQAGVPSSASDTGKAGSMAWDDNYVYVCTATDTWKRAALSTW